MVYKLDNLKVYIIYIFFIKKIKLLRRRTYILLKRMRYCIFERRYIQNKTSLPLALVKAMVDMAESAVFAAYFHTNPTTPYPPISLPHTNLIPKPKTCNTKKSLKLRAVVANSSSSSSLVSSWFPNQTVGGQGANKITRTHKRVFFLDVNPLCYKGSTPSLQSFAHWVSLFFSQVSLTDPVIAVISFSLCVYIYCI